MYAICFLTVRPSELFYDFVQQLIIQRKCDVYICIDDNNYEIPNYNTNDNVHIIKINSEVCERDGFKSTVLWLDNKACSRDKALFYFCKRNTGYKYIWFIEEDVFIPSVKIITNLNNKYRNNADLLVASHNIVYEKQIDCWHWNHINSQIKINPPYATSMICAIRCSRKLLNCIHDYANEHNNLFMDEALFNTIALHNNLKVETPDELSTIVWKRHWNIYEIDQGKLYHPMKSMWIQCGYRNVIQKCSLLQDAVRDAILTRKTT